METSERCAARRLIKAAFDLDFPTEIIWRVKDMVQAFMTFKSFIFYIMLVCMIHILDPQLIKKSLACCLWTKKRVYTEYRCYLDYSDVLTLASRLCIIFLVQPLSSFIFSQNLCLSESDTQKATSNIYHKQWQI